MKLYSASILMFAVSLTRVVPPASAEPTSENNERLRAGLKRFPEADANKDGVLSASEATAFLARKRGARGRSGKVPNLTVFAPTAKDIEEAGARGLRLAKGQEPVAFEKGDGLRVLMTGHSWVAPGRKTLPAIAAAAGYGGHRQRSHTSGGATGAANAIWLKEFGKWKEGAPPNPVLMPAVLTGSWDVMTWGSYYGDKPTYYSQWIDLCLKHNPDMVFFIQDGWPRFNPNWTSLAPDEIRKEVDAHQAEVHNGFYLSIYEALEDAYPGKVRIIPASRAVVDLIHQYLDGQLDNLDCVDEKSQGGSCGIYRDGGHLSRSSGIEHLVGYLYYGMLYRKSPATIADYFPEDIPDTFDLAMRRAAWRAIVESPFAGVDDDDGDGVAD